MARNRPTKYATNADALKYIDEILLPDIRFKSFGWCGPDDFHKELELHQLNPEVPKSVHQQFETARNLILYSWYVYSFSAIANLVAYSALEHALLLRLGPEGVNLKGKSKGLKKLMRLAMDKGCWKDEKLRHFLRLKEVANSCSWIENEQRIPDDPQSDHWLQRLEHSFPNLRNSLAHGFPALHPPEFAALSLCCDLINQLYPKEAQSDCCEE